MQEDKTTILYVDDEEMNLFNFKVNFRKSYNILTAESAKQGMEILNSHDVQIVISDQRMPETTGLEFIKEVSIQFPDIICMILTAFIETETILEALNNGGVHRFIAKPWKREELRPIIEKGIESYCLKKNNAKLIEELRKSEAKYRNIVNTSNDGIIIIDLKGNILDANTNLEKRLSLPKTILLTLNFLDIISPKDRKKFERYLEEAQDPSSELVEISETEYTNKAGVKNYIEIKATRIQFDDLDAILVLSRNITERKQTEQKILNAIINAEEKERERFSHELHDGLGPMLSTIKMYFQWLGETTDEEKKTIIFEKGKENIDETIEMLKEISNNLSPRTLNRFGLISATKNFIKHIEEISKLNIELKYNTEQRFEPKVETTFYRIITELINNTLKHAQAAKINIDIEFNPEENTFRLEYADDGIGFNFEEELENGSGLGMSNITQRIKTLGGNLNNIPQEKGMKIRINLSLKDIYNEN